MKRKTHRYKYTQAAVVGLGLLLAVIAVPSGRAAAEPVGSATAKDSLVLCSHIDELPANDRGAALKHGLQLAEEAVAADNRDAKAHFALFCNLGMQMQIDGLGFSSWSTYRRLRRELDTTLALAPNDPDALAAKGAMLLHLPRLLGGDPDAAERLLRRALTIEPDNSAARRYLAELLAERGDNDAAQGLVASHVAH